MAASSLMMPRCNHKLSACRTAWIISTHTQGFILQLSIYLDMHNCCNLESGHTCVQTIPPGLTALCMASKKGCKQHQGNQSQIAPENSTATNASTTKAISHKPLLQSQQQQMQATPRQSLTSCCWRVGTNICQPQQGN